jgi:hypothetical protein
LFLILREHVAHPAREAALEAARFCDDGQVGRHGIVARARCLLVGERRREVIGEPGGARLDLALIVGLGRDLVFGRNGRGLWDREAGSARLRQCAERHQLQAVTDLADFAVDLEPALELPAIEFAERSRE